MKSVLTIPCLLSYISIQINSVKEINVKNGVYYFFSNIVNIKDLDPDSVKIEENRWKLVQKYFYILNRLCDTKERKIKDLKENKYLTLVLTLLMKRKANSKGMENYKEKF